MMLLVVVEVARLAHCSDVLTALRRVAEVSYGEDYVGPGAVGRLAVAVRASTIVSPAPAFPLALTTALCSAEADMFRELGPIRPVARPVFWSYRHHAPPSGSTGIGWSRRSHSSIHLATK